jgi:hypothetical protein
MAATLPKNHSAAISTYRCSNRAALALVGKLAPDSERGNVQSTQRRCGAAISLDRRHRVSRDLGRAVTRRVDTGQRIRIHGGRLSMC